MCEQVIHDETQLGHLILIIWGLYSIIYEQEMQSTLMGEKWKEIEGKSMKGKEI